MINPVLRREIKTSLRTWKTFYSIALYLFVLAALLSLFVFISVSNSYYGGFEPETTVQLYFVLSGFQFALTFLIVPSLTGGAISGERERQTLDLMLITKMSTVSIIVGKLLSSIIIVLLMVVASMPIYAVLFYYGGISITDLFLMIVFIVVHAGFVGSMSIFFSSLFKKTVVSIIFVYIIILAVTLGTYVIAMISYYIGYMNDYQNELHWLYYYILLMGNPSVGFLSLVDLQSGQTIIDELFTGMTSGYSYIAINYTWLANLISNVIFTVFFVVLSAKKINPVRPIKIKKVS